MEPSIQTTQTLWAAQDGTPYTTKTFFISNPAYTSTVPQNPNIVPQLTSPTANAPAYKYKELLGTCEISNSSGSTIGPYACEKLVPAWQIKNSNNPPAIAAAVVFGLLFLAVALVLGFVIWRIKRRPRHGNEQNESYPLKETADQQAVASLQSQLQLERRRTTDLQAALLSQNAGGGSVWTSNPPKDDRDVKRSFAQISGEIKDYASNYYRGAHSVGVHNVGSEMKEILDECLEGWEQMVVGDGRRRTLLVRIVCGEVLRRTWVEGKFLGKNIGRSFSMFEEAIGSSLSTKEAHLWRLQALAPVLRTIDEKTRTTAVTTVTDRLSSMLAPFLPPNPHQGAKGYLYATISRMSSLYFELVTQNAHYSLQPYFSLTNASQEVAGFEYATCEDVEQKFEIETDDRGREWSQAEGHRITGFVFPVVIKYGDGRGGGWDNGVVVVSKAMVLL